MRMLILLVRLNFHHLFWRKRFKKTSNHYFLFVDIITAGRHDVVSWPSSYYYLYFHPKLTSILFFYSEMYLPLFPSRVRLGVVASATSNITTCKICLQVLPKTWSQPAVLLYMIPAPPPIMMVPKCSSSSKFFHLWLWCRRAPESPFQVLHSTWSCCRAQPWLIDTQVIMKRWSITAGVY